MTQIKLFTRLFFYTLLSIIFLEIVSFYGYFNPSVNTIIFFLVLFVTLILSFRRLEYGAFIILAELFIGSKGYLFSLEYHNLTISIRIGLFLIVLTAWLFYLIKNKKFEFSRSPFFKWYLVLFLFLVFGLINSFLKGNSLSNIFFDFNGWLFFILIFIFPSALNNFEKVQKVLQVIFSATFFLILKTVALFYLFSHQVSVLTPSLYAWVRQTGVGEITSMPNNFYRIFFQSHIFAIIIFFLVIILLISLKKEKFIKKDYLGFWLLSLFTALVIFISYSRSFWLGALLGVVGLYYLIFFILKLTMKKAFLATISLLLIISGAYLLAYGIIKFPWPNPQGVSGGLIEERTKDLTTEAGSASRFQLLPPLITKIKERPFLGSGFGTTITYQTKDPRFLSIHPDGIYTTYAFEWGYLDIWVKIGFIGLLVYLLLLFQIFRRGWQLFRNNAMSEESKTLTLGLIFGIFLLMVINVTTPYLNHPLGIGYLLLVTSYLLLLEKQTNSQKYQP